MNQPMAGIELRAPFGLAQIRALIPHRPPFLMVDEVMELEPSKRIVASRTVGEAECFAPPQSGRGGFPGPYVVEAIAQAACVLSAVSVPDDGVQRIPVLVSIDKARFILPVFPLARILLTVRVVRTWGPVWRLKGEATVDGKVVCRTALSATIVELALLAAAARKEVH